MIIVDCFPCKSIVEAQILHCVGFHIEEEVFLAASKRICGLWSGEIILLVDIFKVISTIILTISSNFLIRLIVLIDSPKCRAMVVQDWPYSSICRTFNLSSIVKYLFCCYLKTSSDEESWLEEFFLIIFSDFLMLVMVATQAPKCRSISMQNCPSPRIFKNVILRERKWGKPSTILHINLLL